MESIYKKVARFYFLLLFVILLAAFFRFYQLGNIPAGLLNDEANAGYDAYSLLLTGRDQWNNFFPINNFIGFGDFQPPLHRYSILIPIYILGLNEFSVRFISALSGVLSVVALYFLVRKLVNPQAAFFSGLLLAIMPWAIGLNRIGHEANLAMFFLIAALFFGLLQKSMKSLFLSIFLLALSMYTYSAYILYAPLALVVVLYVNYNKEMGFGFFIKPLIFFLIVISPIILLRNSASVRFSQVGLTTNINSVGLINDLNDARGQCLIVFNPVVCKLTDNKANLFVTTFVKNYLLHFSTGFIYTSGTPTQFSILPKRGLDYLFNFPLLILGIIFLLTYNKHKKLNIAIFILFLFAVLPDSLTSDGNYIRSTIMIPFLALFSGLGVYYILIILKDEKKLRHLFIGLFISVIFYSSVTFFVTYITYFKNNYAIFSQYGYRDLMKKTYSIKNDYDRIYISRHLNDAKQYIYYLFYNQINPVSYQSKKGVDYTTESNEWISIDRINNIYFVDFPPKTTKVAGLSNKKVLIISNPADFPKGVRRVLEVKDKLGNVIFAGVNASDLLEYEKKHKLQSVP